MTRQAKLQVLFTCVRLQKADATKAAARKNGVTSWLNGYASGQASGMLAGAFFAELIDVKAYKAISKWVRE